MPPASFWQRFGRRIVLGILLPLVVLGGVLAFAAFQGRQTDQTSRSGPSSGDQQQAAETPIQTDRGRRYANVDAIGQLDSAQTLEAAHAIVQDFLKQYDLSLHTTSVQPSAYLRQYGTFNPLAESDLSAFRAYAKVFIDEWAKYPRDWVRASNVEHIMIIKGLAIGDTARAAAPDPVGDALYYDIGYGADSYAREVVHHEYNHLVEYQHFNSYAREDAAWTDLNPPGFRYNPAGGVAAYHEAGFANDPHPEPGFVNRYATYGIEEDKAEVYAYLMTRDYYHDLKEWIRTDERLAQKVRLYQDFMVSVSPHMDRAYFDAINP